MSEIYDALRRVQEQREGHMPPENGSRTNTMLEEILHQAEAILRFSEDVQRRMSEVGVDGIGGVLTLYSQLRSAIDRVAQSEIEASAADVSRLVETMQHLRDELHRVKALKQTVEGIR
jgi:methyl-accepting chemotaxis protein